MNQTITFLSKWFDSDFERFIAPKLREAFPNVSFLHLQQWEHDASEWLDQSQIDIRLDGALYENRWMSDELCPLDPTTIPVDTYHPKFISKITDDQGNIYGVPFNIGSTYIHGLLYNKDLFDAFRAPYPESGMTWDELIALSRQVSGLVDNKIIYGLDIGDPSLIKMQLGVTFLDPITHEPRLDEATCKEYFRIIREAYHIPGNLQDSNERLFVYGKAFSRKGNVAMCIHYPETLMNHRLKFKSGLIKFPSLKEFDAVPSIFHPGVLYANPHSKDYSLTVEVMMYLSSDTFQMHLARLGLHPAKIGRKYENSYAQDVENLVDQSMSWVSNSNKKGWPDPQSPYELEASSIVNKEMEFAVRGWRSWDKSIAAIEQSMKQMLESKQVAQ